MTELLRPAIGPDSTAEEVATEIKRWVTINVPKSWREAAILGPEHLKRARTPTEYEAWYPTLGRAGLVAPTWPVDYGGLDVGREVSAVIEAELRYLSLRVLNPLGLNNTASAL